MTGKLPPLATKFPIAKKMLDSATEVLGNGEGTTIRDLGLLKGAVDKLLPQVKTAQEAWYVASILETTKERLLEYDQVQLGASSSNLDEYQVANHYQVLDKGLSALIGKANGAENLLGIAARRAKEKADTESSARAAAKDLQECFWERSEGNKCPK